MCVCMYVCMHACIYIYICINTCMYVRMYVVCMKLYILLFISIFYHHSLIPLFIIIIKSWCDDIKYTKYNNINNYKYYY